MASISWTDSVGAATLDNDKPIQGGRFRSWTPSSPPFGDVAFPLGSGERHMFKFRDDYMASFEMPAIPNTEMEKMLRLQKHLYEGGEVSVATGDASSRTYATCQLPEGGEVEIEFSDDTFLEYTMRFTLLNVAAVPGHMLCIYS